MKEIQMPSEMEEELPPGFFTSKREKEKTASPEVTDEEEDDSFIEPYEDYAEKEQLGEGDIEVGPDPLVPDEMPAAPEIAVNDKAEVREHDPAVEENSESLPDDTLEDLADNDGNETGSASIMVRIIEDTGDFMSEDGNTYNLKKNEIASFPVNVGTVLIAANKAEPIERTPTGR